MILHELDVRQAAHESHVAIIRIIGNENPPRDSVGRRLEVLEEILDKEPNFEGVVKWYIINRINNIQYRRSLCELLDKYNAKYITIPLDRTSVLQAVNRKDKILKAIEINKVRNFAVDFGKHIAKYTVVLDGDCMFDRDGWREVHEESKEAAYEYLSIPHKRYNGPLAEPMIAFRYDANKRFDESICFGDGDKLRFLFDIGHVKDTANGHRQVLGHLTKTVGYVHHLSTGNDLAESDLKTRIDLRDQSLDLLIDSIQTNIPIRTGGFNEYYKSIDMHGLDFDYTGQYSAVALDIQDSAHIVEVGSWLGKSSIYLATELMAYGKRARIDCIDTWDGGDCPELKNRLSQIGDVYKEFNMNVVKAGVNHMINPVRKKSTEAASLYEDQTIDFIWIDADHNFDHVTADINVWYPKLKVGGMIAGHDFAINHPVSRCGVVKAVLEFFKDKNLEIQPFGRAWKHIKYSDNWPKLRVRKWV